MTFPISIRLLLLTTLSLPIALGMSGCAKDTEPPIMRLGARDSVDWPQGSPFNPPTIVAFDKQDLDLSEQVEIGGNLDVSKVGNYTVIYSATDKAGNRGEIEQFVHVYPTTTGLLGQYRSVSSCNGCPSEGHTRVTLYPFDDIVVIRPVMGDSSFSNTSNMLVRVEQNGDLTVESCSVPCGYTVNQVAGYSRSDSIFVFFELHAQSNTFFCSTVYVKE